MKKIFLISCALVTSLTVANPPQKSEANRPKDPEATVDCSFYAQCVKPNIDLLKKKFNEHKPTLEKHAKALHASAVMHSRTFGNFYNEFSKTPEYSIAKTSLGFGLLADLVVHRAGRNHYRGDLGYIVQVAAGLYCMAPLTKQLYNDLLKRK
jgi:hypothetical protein